MEFSIAPSSVRSEEKIIKVASFIFDVSFTDINHFRQHVSKEVEQSESYYSLTKSHEISGVLKWYVHNWKGSHNVTVEEEPGYLLLGNLLTFFATAMESELGFKFKYHAQRQVCKNSTQGRNPSTDGAIIHCLVSKEARFITEVLYEYKPAVHEEILIETQAFLIELFLQTHYIMRYEKKNSIIACLTDLFTWHYFKLSLTSGTKVKILWYRKLTLSRPENTKQCEIENHLCFLLHHVQHISSVKEYFHATDAVFN